MFALIAVLVFSLWLPLILLHPDIFREQFGSNVFRRAGPGLGSTLLAPWSVLGYQLGQIWEYFQPVQAVLTAWRWRRFAGGLDDTRVARFRVSPLGELAPLIFFEGKHPTLGYYAYPAATDEHRPGDLRQPRQRPSLEPAGVRCRPFCSGPLPWLVFGSLLLAFLPGAGLRTLLANLRHLNDPAYDHTPSPAP